ncbi:MAG: hypothetical protein KDA25_09225 [Phycisphaerales bacterium]|nr:hypothetical protein [Phycisphaerales bacterium]
MRITRLRFGLGSLVVATLCAGGCQSTAPLGGTSWDVVKVLASTRPDAEAIEVEFARDGRLTTTTRDADGTIAVSDNERYRVHGRMFTVTQPDHRYDVLYRFTDDGTLVLVSEQFHAVLKPR